MQKVKNTMESKKYKERFLLVHGLCHGAWTWYKLKTQLEAAGHYVTVVDLAASGINMTSLEEIKTLKDYCKPLLDFLSSLCSDDEKVILVAHSIGGICAALAADVFPCKIAAVVFMTAFMPDTRNPPAYVYQKGTVIQGFIPFGKIRTYVPHMKAGGTYRLHNFFGSTNKTNYRVADPNVTITFSWNSVLSELVDSSICFLEDRFRIHRFEEFDAACDMKGDLYDYIGHIKLVNGEVPSGSLLLDEAKIAASRCVDIHVQTHDDPVLKLCLWDQAASEFWKKFKASGGTARVILVTTLNPKRYGVLSLSSMTPSRVFLDSDVQETRSYLSWLSSNLEVANRVRADVVVKPEEATLGELLSYMKKTSAKVAWFECTATIDDVVHGSKWYYIGCGECHTKATKGPTTLMCKKCGKSEIVGVAQYLSKLSVYDHKDQAFFVLLGSAGEELFGKKAAELVDGYYEANDGVGDDDIVPVPQVMLDTIGQTRKFIVKISTHNLEGKTQTLTVTKVLPPEDPAPEGILGEAADEENGIESEDHADDSVKRATDVIESEIAKRAKCG